MNKTKLLITFLLLFTSVLAFAQNLTVTGTVKDSSTGEPVPFAAIQLKGTMTGGMTDGDGLYSISVPGDGILVFSSVGYKELEVAVAGKAVLNVELAPDTEMIEETIVVAFGTATKESFTGSATVVKSSDISKTQSSDATRALEGMVAGVQMTTSSGTLGSSPSIMIRGISSINAGTAPLYVVDGVPYSGDMNNLNSSDIESMTVLKDAASNALYGARGANGVIMITTKKAKLGEAKVTVDAKWGLNTKALKSYDYITDPGLYYETHYNALYNYYRLEQGMSDDAANLKAAQNLTGAASEGGLGYLTFTVPEGELLIGRNGKLNPNAVPGRMVTYYGEKYWLQPDDWMDAAYKNSMRQEYNVNVAGTTGNAQIFASFGYLDNKGIIDGQDMKRYTARIRTDYQAKEYLKIGMNAGYTNFNWNNGNSDEGSAGSVGNIFGFATMVAPIYPVFLRNADKSIKYDEHGYKRFDYGDGSNAGMTRPVSGNANALQEVTLNTNNSEGNAINGTGYVEVKFLKDFVFTFNAGVGIDETRSTNVLNMYYGQFAPNGGIVTKSHGRSSYLNLQQLLNWGHTFAEKHNVSVLLGHEWYKSKGVSLGASKSNMFSLDNQELGGAVIDGQSASSGMSQYNNEGYFFRGQYDYMNKIFASVSFRRDASSRFHPDHRWGNFWSLGGGWLINYEPWFRVPWIDMLKVKASIGSQGNDNIADYLYTDMYGISNADGEIGVSRGSIGNPDITWETNTNFNIGTDFDLFRGRLSGTIEYFYRLTSDMLYFFSYPMSTGYSGVYDNVGDMSNTGIEFAFNGNILRGKNFSWDAYLNFTHYVNKVISIPDKNSTAEVEGYSGFVSGASYVGEGLPINTFYLRKFAGVNQETGESQWYVDTVGEDGNVVRGITTSYNDASYYLCGNPIPDLYGGFGTSLSFYGFDLSLAFTYQIGGLAYDSGYATYMASPIATSLGMSYHKDVLKAWTAENKSEDIPRFRYDDNYTAASSDRFLTNASYLNFQNAQLGYTLPRSITERIRVSALRFYLTCDNIWYISARKGFDPRFNMSGTSNYAVNSPVRTISGGISLTF